MTYRTLAHEERRKRIALLGIIAFASVMMWQTAWGSLMLYPFTILATWFHEMGHGLAAMAVGYDFQRLEIYPDGSGVALSLVPLDGSRLAAALVAAAGPVGPALAGAGLIMASRRERGTHWALGILGAALLLSTLVWVRSITGWLVLVPAGLVILGIAVRAGAETQRLVLQVLGVQAAVSMYQHLGYLFSQGGRIGGVPQRSDTQAIADVLLLPYWFWGAAITALTAIMLWRAFRYALQP